MLSAAIIYPVHNALTYVKRSLPQILATTPDHVALITVADACNDETNQYLYRVHLDHIFSTPPKPRQTYFRKNTRQQLFTRTVNRGMRNAYHRWKPDVMVIVNTDCDLRNGWFDALLKGMQIYPRLGMVGYRDQPDDAEWKKRAYSEVRLPQYVTGHCMALRTQMLEEIGVLCETDIDGREDPNLANYLGQAHIGSERILCWKGMAAGWQAMNANSPFVFHEPGKSWGHDLGWLSHFKLDPLWPACDTLDEPTFYGEAEPDLCACGTFSANRPFKGCGYEDDD